MELHYRNKLTKLTTKISLLKEDNVKLQNKTTETQMSIVKLLYSNDFDSVNVSRRIIERPVPDQQIPISTNETTLERIIEVISNELPVKITSCRIKSVNYTRKVIQIS